MQSILQSEEGGDAPVNLNLRASVEQKLHLYEGLPSIEMAYVGPPLSQGPLPALFYFSLSAKDSLCLDPFNQPAAYLSSLPMRIFSMTLPGHEKGLPPTEALYVWAREMESGRDVISSFAEKVAHAVDLLTAEGVLFPDRLAIAGLSRGAFLAAHAAALTPAFKWILGFAPLTTLSVAKEFQHLAHSPAVAALSLEHLAEKLSDRNVRFYIGNLDTRVGTRRCFDCTQTWSQTALSQGIRSPKIELIISPSIGRDGHGTSKEVFHHGAQWIAEQLKAIDVV